MIQLFCSVGTVVCLLITGLRQEDEQQAQEQNVTWPQFIVIFNYQTKVGDPLVNMRVVLRAKNEGDASVRALLHLQESFNVDGKKLEFIEAVEKTEKPPEPKK